MTVRLAGTLIVAGLLAAGCSRPNQANIALRKENALLRDRVAVLDRLQAAPPSTTQATGAVDFGQLYTAQAIQIGRLTTVEEGVLYVYAAPTDEDGDVLKSAGSFEVRAFDVTRGDKLLIGEWSFDAPAVRRLWSPGLVRAYRLACPLPADRRTARKLTVLVTFTDRLTGRVLTNQATVTVP